MRPSANMRPNTCKVQDIAVLLPILTKSDGQSTFRTAGQIPGRHLATCTLSRIVIGGGSHSRIKEC